MRFNARTAAGRPYQVAIIYGQGYGIAYGREMSEKSGKPRSTQHQVSRKIKLRPNRRRFLAIQYPMKR